MQSIDSAGGISTSVVGEENEEQQHFKPATSQRRTILKDSNTTPSWNQDQDYLTSDDPIVIAKPKKSVSIRGFDDVDDEYDDNDEEEQRPVSKVFTPNGQIDESEISSHPSESGGMIVPMQKEQSTKRLSRDEIRAEKQAEMQRRKLLRASQAPSQYTVGGNLKRKHCYLRFLKCGGMSLFIILTIFLCTYGLIWGFSDSDDTSGDPSEDDPSYDIQQVLPGQLISLSTSGTVAAMKDDFDSIQMYSHDVEATEQPYWQRMGQQSFSVIGDRVSLSRNGTIVAFVSKTDRRPHILQYDSTIQIWIEMDAPLIICDELSMDIDAKFLTIGAYNRLDIGSWQDFIASYEFDDGSWTEAASRLEMEHTIHSFEMSPTANFLMISSIIEIDKSSLSISFGNATNSSSVVSIYRLSVEELDPQWMKLDTEIVLDSPPNAWSLAENVFAIASSNDTLNVFSYSGRVWGQDMYPRDGANSTFASVALSLDGRTLAVGDITANNTGIVNRYTFPWTADTGDDWEETGPPLEYDWQLDEGYVYDEYGKEARDFGSHILLDGVGSVIAVQSGLEGNQNVHFYDIVFDEPMDANNDEEGQM